MLACYALDDNDTSTTDANSIVDIYACSREGLPAMCQRHGNLRDAAGNSLDNSWLAALGENENDANASTATESTATESTATESAATESAATESAWAERAQSASLLALKILDAPVEQECSKKADTKEAYSKEAYLCLLSSIDDLWLWASLPSRLLATTSQQTIQQVKQIVKHKVEQKSEQKIFRLVEPLDEAKRARAILAWGLASYVFEKFQKTRTKTQPLRLLIDASNNAECEAAEQAEIICEGRSLINTPANILTPAAFEQLVQKIANDSNGHLNAIRGEELQAQNYPLIYAVGKSAREPPRLLDLRWQTPTGSNTPNGKKAKSLTIVGKGVCFDSGGLNMKNASAMLLMKKDMGGAASAICLAQLLRARRSPINLRLLLPIVENAVSRDAMRPMDIYDSRKGDSVEIGHTDAEGRLLLADALWEASAPDTYQKAQTQNLLPELAPDLIPDLVPDLVIDFATLTGAARVATGPMIPNLFTNNDKLAALATLHAQAQQDPMWHIPLVQEYRNVLDSRCADILSASTWQYAGAITAALFLQNFVAKGVPWIHLDMMGWNDKARPGRPEGGEIQAVRAMTALVEQWCQQ